VKVSYLRSGCGFSFETIRWLSAYTVYHEPA
jgi:hypothetical protein